MLILINYLQTVIKNLQMIMVSVHILYQNAVVVTCVILLIEALANSEEQNSITDKPESK